MKKHHISLTVNNTEHELLVFPNQTLAQVLRKDLALTGVKQGCEVGDCGSCTVLLDGAPVNSCLVLAVQAQGGKVTTIEGLAQGNQLHPVQAAMVEHGGIQCGFCSPGMILSAKALLDKKPDAGPEEIKRALSGNLCRCTGYQKILEAVEDAGRRMGRS
jgi:carbon-monoxide dehydrogenase small subunit